MGRDTGRRSTIRFDGGQQTTRPDTLAAEEPLEIRVNGEPLSVTMRTPGNDFDLVAGFLVTEGVTAATSDVVAMRYCAGATVDGTNTYNVIDAALAHGVAPPTPSLQRNFYTTSSCGVCGKASIDAVRTVSRWSVADDATPVSRRVLMALPDALRGAQSVFDKTGGLHAAALFSGDGTLLCVREDVGRHNAVDKVVGWATREDRLPLHACVLMVSGRASFELVQKAVMAGIPVLAAVSAPSTLAVDLAVDVGMTLAGFVRGETMDVYAGAERLTP